MFFESYNSNKKEQRTKTNHENKIFNKQTLSQQSIISLILQIAAFLYGKF